MIIVSRNPKDAAVSFYNHVRNHTKYRYRYDFDTFFSIFVSGLCVNGSSYFDFYREYWQFYKERKTDVLWLNYEDFVISSASKKKQIQKIIDFIGVSDAIDWNEEDLDMILMNSSVDQMKKQYDGFFIENLVRSGTRGDWKNYLSEAQSEIIDNLLTQHFHTAPDFKYYQELHEQ